MAIKQQTEFTRFENQYILNMAIDARYKQIENKKNGFGEIDPHIDKYIETLEAIAKKAGENMKAYDENDLSK